MRSPVFGESNCHPFPAKHFCHSWSQLHSRPPAIIYYPASGLNKPQIYLRSLRAVGRGCKQQLSLGRTGCIGTLFSFASSGRGVGMSKDAQWNIRLSALIFPNWSGETERKEFCPDFLFFCPRRK